MSLAPAGCCAPACPMVSVRACPRTLSRCGLASSPGGGQRFAERHVPCDAADRSASPAAYENALVYHVPHRAPGNVGVAARVPDQVGGERAFEAAFAVRVADRV